MTTPDRDSLSKGLVSIGEEAVAKSNDALFYAYFTDDYVLHSPAGEFNREDLRAYSQHCARASPTTRSAGHNSSWTATSSPRAP